MKFVALLRGINVGKSVQVPMKDLKKLLEEVGLRNVETYLNSGNVLFDSELDVAELTQVIFTTLERRFGKRIPVLVKNASEIIAIRDSIPVEWNSNEFEQTYVVYLFGDIAKPEILDELPIKRQYLEIKYAHSAIIWNIKKENYNRSQITKIAGHPVYSQMTTRNVNTARKLAELCNGQ
jgi:uncharacterized protein (DUF1697 family)